MKLLARSIDNDTRGWILSAVSGLACVFGASIICVDVFVRLLPGKANFRIQDSNVFLACSLSLSFGVMLFSSLYSMLPESKEYFQQEGWSDQAAGLVMMAFFAGGFIGIQAVSRLVHQFMPSHVVDCDHSHGSPPDNKISDIAENGDGQPPTSEVTPLLSSEHVHTNPMLTRHTSEMVQRSGSPPPSARSRAITDDTVLYTRRQSTPGLRKRMMSFFWDTDCRCDESKRCYGYTDPCGQECFKHLSSRAASNTPSLRASTGHFHAHHSFHATHDHGDGDIHDMDEGDAEAQHHHHVPANAFLSIGLQTSIAIALHKFPEGFITYATNHVNPALGFNVFMALFVHNISEGFAMALPLYMALGSRWRAMAWSALLGGLSQPLGAAIAALWFKLANSTNISPSGVVYGCLFALTSGIMVSVGLQLFVESLSFNHNHNLCMLFAFLGMSMLGLSNALFAEH
ncbi:ZIP zinc transporter domain-containing protein [Trichoderma breve]|uniref:ZIP zinc transporter domain-containing protein n=1 Tax=Trichoderma breve TaxID=2034170 RepID=A0A9W9E8Y7_9HYPO|nr:ZIP zinc transporter domain-containing protein [Trichoderma breve]KAJ4861007.1 ZIP zinc transporter domain-containing protein [Trichoderma breve]